MLGYLAADPSNLQLLADAAEAALDEGRPDEVQKLLDRHAALAPLTPALLNLQAVAALSCGRFEEAAAGFERLIGDGHDSPALRFNLAWAKAMLGDHARAAELLDGQVTASVPRAAALKIRALHHLDRLPEALAEGEKLAAAAPEDRDLLGALATVALDDEQGDLARSYAERAGGGAEALSALGALTLGENKVDEAMALFEGALAERPDSPRALLGKGMGLVAKGDAAGAAPFVDRAARGFGDHVGSWVAAGWAYYVAGDRATSRQRFETALALDENFAESHGALAVLDIADGAVDSAKRRTEIALRLDRNCFSAALAKSMLLAADGNEAAAERVRALALNRPVGEGGQTIAQAMAALGPGMRSGGGRR
jgi:tetratricopeptide (TPR) repeat protein